MPAVTVLVPSYNHAPFVEAALRSIFAQTGTVEKLIVIDDGSKDESAAVIRRVLADCPIDHEFIARENRGLPATLNEGLARAETEYFAYLGSDDIWLPAFLREQVALLESRPRAVLAFGHAYVIDEEDNIVDRTDNWSAFADGDMLLLLLRGVIFSSPTVVYRTAPLKKYGWNEDARLEDYELYLKLSGTGEFARNEKLLSAWRQHGRNTSDDFSLMLREQIEAQNRVAGALGIDPAKLENFQRERKFRAVFDLLRNGGKREAFALFRESAAAGSAADKIKLLLRFAVPNVLFRWNRRRKRRVNARRYGKLKID